MNAVEIEEAISALAEQPFDTAEFPYAFLEAFGRKETALKRALKFKLERGRLPSITAADPWEKRMAEGVAFLARMKAEVADG
ncbi:type IIL restriction-modification enzyme MmeI [Phreatobacter sp.]|uniref:type IIL restriction-modification enzyme MmeI n=1 Tax=Phreatobacter sp. TaxID=1966341 RepID=UPI0025D3BA68|nr:type IIL restriction-modification enzyme MmeI [Phreatobacter sp.]